LYNNVMIELYSDLHIFYGALESVTFVSGVI